MKKNKMIHVAWLILILGMAFSIYNGVAALTTTTNEDMFELSSADEYVIANRTTKHFLYDSLNGVYPLFSGIENPR